MPEFRIEELLAEEPFTTDHGSFVAYKVRFTGDMANGEAWQNRKANSPTPVAGEVMDCEYPLPETGGKPKLKRIYRQGGGSSNGSTKSSGGDFRTPQQIMRSDAHGKAMHWCDIKVAAGEWKPITWEQYIAMVDRYYDDIKSAA